MRLIDADYLKTWFGEKDLYTYDYIIGTIDDAPTVKAEPKLFAEVKIDKEDLENLVAEKVEEIKEAISNTSNALKPLDNTEKEEIHVGDEVQLVGGSRCIVWGIENGIAGLLFKDGGSAPYPIDKLIKTGRHFEEVEKLLERMREE